MDLKYLLEEYSSGHVIPVIGCELLKIKIEGGMVNIHDYLIQKSQADVSNWPFIPTTLSELPLACADINSKSIAGNYNDIHPKSKDTSLLRKLAALKNFKVYLMASSYTDLEKEMHDANPSQPIDILKNSVLRGFSLPDLDFSNDHKKVVYLFDDMRSPKFALNDEDLLESIHSLSVTHSITQNNPNSLLSYLQDRTLLFIGCDFPDWFMRYCIRVLCNKPFTKSQPIYIINDAPRKITYHDHFFKQYNIKLFHSSPVNDFVDAFCRQAMRKQDFENKYENARPFICYSREFDSGKAFDLYEKLRADGIDPWLDEEDKENTSHISKIQNTIMDGGTKCIISVISADLVERMENTKDTFNYIRDIEWKAAITRIEGSRFSKNGDTFSFIPFFLDDPRPYKNKLPPHIQSEFEYGELFGGYEKLFSSIQKLLV